MQHLKNEQNKAHHFYVFVFCVLVFWGGGGGGGGVKVMDLSQDCVQCWNNTESTGCYAVRYYSLLFSQRI
jgi:hypothetical protein